MNILKEISRLKKNNGNGVFLKIYMDQYNQVNYQLSVVYCNGWSSDQIVIYSESDLTFAGNIVHSLTTEKAIQSLIKVYENYKLGA